VQNGAHIVEGTAVTNGTGNGTVSFTSPATFTSGTSYSCTLTPEAGGNPAADGTILSSKTGSGFTFKSTLNNTTFDYICVGNWSTPPTPRPSRGSSKREEPLVVSAAGVRSWSPGGGVRSCSETRGGELSQLAKSLLAFA
jgi:hypothetical protein